MSDPFDKLRRLEQELERESKAEPRGRCPPAPRKKDTAIARIGGIGRAVAVVGIAVAVLALAGVVLKLLPLGLLGLAVYFVYRIFFAPERSDSGKDRSRTTP